MTIYAKGSCLCQAVSYTVSENIAKVVFCHCSLCRKQTGLYFATVAAKEKNVSIDGGENLNWYEDINHAKRGFCQTCGSALFWKSSRETLSEYIEILAGSLNDRPRLNGVMHIHCAGRAEFYQINDDLPQYDGPPP